MNVGSFTFIFGIILLALGAMSYTIRLDGGYFSAAGIFCVVCSVIIFAGNQIPNYEQEKEVEDE